MVTIIITHIVCNGHLYELFLFFFFATLTTMVACIIIYRFSCEIFLFIFFLATITILAACITHYCHLYRSFSFIFFSFSFSFFFWRLQLQSYVLFIMIACDLFIYCLNYNHMYFLLWLFERDFFSPCCNNCSYACGHKYHVLGITDMSKVFFSNFYSRSTGKNTQVCLALKWLLFFNV
jgi:hypothetical protein